MILTFLANRVGHERVAHFLLRHLPVGALHTLLSNYLGRLTASDPRLYKTTVPEVTIDQILAAMKAVEAQGVTCPAP